MTAETNIILFVRKLLNIMPIVFKIICKFVFDMENKRKKLKKLSFYKRELFNSL